MSLLGSTGLVLAALVGVVLVILMFALVDSYRTWPWDPDRRHTGDEA